MDDKKKILLGEEDILSKENEDIFISVNLGKTFSEIRNDKFDNEFDVEKQFSKERNSSRDFRIYGIIDSTIIDCDNLNISAYHSAFSGTGANSGTTFLSGFVKSISSTELVYDGINVYNKKRGKYLLELTGYTHDFVYLKIPSNNFSYKDQIYPQQLIFKDADGNFVSYGTQTIDIDENGNSIEINNNFYFLYNKHWIKKDLLIQEEKPAVISFSATPQVTIVPEIPLASLFTAFTASIYPFYVVLDKPSPFGLEQADLVINSRTLDLPEIFVLDSAPSIQTLPISLTFSPGEQIKQFYFVTPEDSVQEFTENVVFELNNFQFVSTGDPLTRTFLVTDTTPRNKVNLNFQNIYQNRNYFTGIVDDLITSSFSYPMGAVLRNGLMFEGTPMEFYPSDDFNLKITNIGNTTILPVNPSLGVFVEQSFSANQSIDFVINTAYENSEKHTINLYFGNKSFTTTQGVSYYGYTSGFTINGVPIMDYWLATSYKFDYDTILAALKKLPKPPALYPVGGWNRYNLETPFDVIEDVSGLTITLVAKSPGTRLDIKPYGFSGDVFNMGDTLASLTFSAETVQPFIQSAQTPLQITLGANFGSNLQARYAFQISKIGYDTMTFTSSTLNASASGTNYYLASGYWDMVRNWDNSTNTPIYYHSGVTSDWSNTTSTGLYDKGEVYINGIVLLANLYFDNTNNTSSYLPGGGSLNQSHFTNQSGTYRADFEPAPITVIPETNSFYSPQNRGQIGYLAMRAGSGSFIPSTVSPHRSFDFRTGTTNLPNTYYTTNYLSQYAAWHWNSYADFYSSGGSISTTNHTTSPTLSIKNYLQNGNTTYGVTSQGLTGTSPVSSAEAAMLGPLLDASSGFYSPSHYIKLESYPGIPFEINNFQELKYVSGPNSGQTYSSYKSMGYIEFQPAEVAGVTINKANNHMGGFSLIQP